MHGKAPHAAVSQVQTLSPLPLLYAPQANDAATTIQKHVRGRLARKE